MDLTINRAHARLGLRRRTGSCPTALALKELGFENVYVDGDIIRIDRSPSDDGCLYYDIPNTLNNAIEEYDNGKPFKVGTYRIKGLKRPRK